MSCAGPKGYFTPLYRRARGGAEAPQPAAQAWVQGYGWRGNIRELSHVMERVTLLHLGEELDAESLTQTASRHQRQKCQWSRTITPDPAPESRCRRSGADSAGALAHGRQCDAGGATFGAEPGYPCAIACNAMASPRPRLDNPPAPSSQLSPRQVREDPLPTTGRWFLTSWRFPRRPQRWMLGALSQVLCADSAHCPLPRMPTA